MLKSRQRNLRVLWVASEYFPNVGGIETMAWETVSGLSRLCETYLVTATGQSHHGEDSTRHVASMNLAYPESQREFYANCRVLNKLVKRLRIQIVHFGSAGLSCYSVALPDGVPFFVTVHCKDFTRPWQQVPSVVDIKEKIADCLRKANSVFCVSSYTQNAVRQRLGGLPSIELMTPGIRMPVQLPSDIDTQAASAHHILTIGKAIRRKGFTPLLKALELVNKPIIWDVVGRGTTDEGFSHFVQSSSMRANVRLHGCVSSANLEKLWTQASIFALTPVDVVDEKGLDAEGFGIVFLEAAMRHVIALGSVFGGCGDAILDGITGRLVNPHDAGSVAQTISELLESEAQRRRLQNTAYQRALDEFRWEDRIAFLVSRYSDAAAPR